MQCPKCSAEVNSLAQFCWQCGATLSSGAPAPHAARQSSGSRWVALAAGLVVLLVMAALLVTQLTRSRSRSVTAGAGSGAGPSGSVTAVNPEGLSATPSAPLTAVAPGNIPTAPPLTATPPGSPPVGSGLPQGNAPTAAPSAEDVAAYLRKLEVIQQRDSQNPMAQLFAMMATGLSGLGGALKDLTEEGVGEAPAGTTPNYLAQFDGMLQAKQGLVRDFRTITPVPQACQRLHALYGRYLDAQARAILDLRNAVAQANNPGAPLAALPAGKLAEAAQTAANQEEEGIRQRYNIPRNAMPLVP